MKLNAEKAKESWLSAGLNEKGVEMINSLIDQLENNIIKGQGRWDAYHSCATFTHDPQGSFALLKNTVEMTK